MWYSMHVGEHLSITNERTGAFLCLGRGSRFLLHLVCTRSCRQGECTGRELPVQQLIVSVFVGQLNSYSFWWGTISLVGRLDDNPSQVGTDKIPHRLHSAIILQFSESFSLALCCFPTGLDASCEQFPCFQQFSSLSRLSICRIFPPCCLTCSIGNRKSGGSYSIGEHQETASCFAVALISKQPILKLPLMIKKRQLHCQE